MKRIVLLSGIGDLKKVALFLHEMLQQAEMARLKRENERLHEENSFLKKVATYFTKESK